MPWTMLLLTLMLSLGTVVPAEAQGPLRRLGQRLRGLPPLPPPPPPMPWRWGAGVEPIRPDGRPLAEPRSPRGVETPQQQLPARPLDSLPGRGDAIQRSARPPLDGPAFRPPSDQGDHRLGGKMTAPGEPADADVPQAIDGSAARLGMVVDRPPRRGRTSRTRGALVQQVHPGSAAEAAGLRQGDLVIAIDGRLVRTPGDLLEDLSARQQGDRVQLWVNRDGDLETLDVTLGGRDGMAEPTAPSATAGPTDTPRRPQGLFDGFGSIFGGLFGGRGGADGGPPPRAADSVAPSEPPSPAEPDHREPDTIERLPPPRPESR